MNEFSFFTQDIFFIILTPMEKDRILGFFPQKQKT